MPPSKRSSRPAGDVTGRKLDELREQQAEEDKARQENLTMATAEQEYVDNNTIIDLSDPEHPVVEEAPPIGQFDDYDVEDNDDGVEVIETADIGMPMVSIRTNEDLKTNVGYGNVYEFKKGQRYKVPLHVAQHLDEKGYVWH